MYSEPDQQILSPFGYLMSAGGLSLTAFGIVMTVWGIFNVLRPRQPRPILVQSLLSLIPGVIAMVVNYLACISILDVVATVAPPKPIELASMAGLGMSIGFFGVAATLIPTVLGICAFWRLCWKNESTGITETRSGP